MLVIHHLGGERLEASGRKAARITARVRRARKSCKRIAGTSLVELMVALAIGAIILAALAAVFFASSLSRRETDRGARQIENGRYAIQLLASELKLSGY